MKTNLTVKTSDLRIVGSYNTENVLKTEKESQV